jgi:hypothetical protein
MTPKQLILRCYCEEKGNIWQAFCIDLNLAAQGTSLEEVKHRLQQQIFSYLFDALAGEDRKYAAQLLKRKAPLMFRLKYHYYKLLCKMDGAKENLCRIFDEIMPLGPLKNAT